MLISIIHTQKRKISLKLSEMNCFSWICLFTTWVLVYYGGGGGGGGVARGQPKFRVYSDYYQKEMKTSMGWCSLDRPDPRFQKDYSAVIFHLLNKQTNKQTQTDTDTHTLGCSLSLIIIIMKAGVIACAFVARKQTCCLYKPFQGLNGIWFNSKPKLWKHDRLFYIRAILITKKLRHENSRCFTLRVIITPKTPDVGKIAKFLEELCMPSLLVQPFPACYSVRAKAARKEIRGM